MPNPNAGRTVEEIRNTPKPQDKRKENEFIVLGTGGKTRIREKEGSEKLQRGTPSLEATKIADAANDLSKDRGLQTNAGQTVKEQPKVRPDTSSSRGQMSVERSNAGQVAQTPTQITREAPMDLTADEIVAGVRQGTLSREQVSQVLQSDPRKARLVRNLMTAQRGVEMIENERKIQGYSTPDKLIEGVTSGVVNDADLMYIKETNPELYNQYQQAQENRYDVLTANMLAGNKPEDQLTSLAAIQNYYMKEFEKLADERKSAKEIRDEVMDTKESQKLFENVTALDDEIEQLQITIEGIEDDVRKEYPGDVTESFIQAQIAKRTKDLQPKVRRLLSEREKAALDYNNYISQSQVDYQLRLEEQRYSDAQKENMLQMQYGMTLQTFEKNWDLTLKELDREEKEYRNQKSFEQQIQLMGIQEEFRKNAAIWDYNLKTKYSTPEQDRQITELSDGTKVAVDMNNPSNIRQIDYTNGQDTISRLGNITSYGGPHDNYQGLDIDMQMGDPIPGIPGRVVNVVTGQGQTDFPSYGNYVDVEDENGYIHRYAHLSDTDVSVGDHISKGDVVGYAGNSGYTIPIGGDGTHLDYSIQKSDGNRLKATEVEGYLSMVMGPDIPEEQIDILKALQYVKPSQPGFKGAVGRGFWTKGVGSIISKAWYGEGEQGMPIGSKAESFAAAVERLKAVLALPNLDKLKGAMSDNDIKFIKAAETDLSIDMDEKRFEEIVYGLENAILSTYNITLEDALDMPDFGMQESSKASTYLP